jgi:hypothetical protein
MNSKNKGDDDNFFCSELIAAALKSMGVVHYDYSSCHFWPGAFAENGEIEKYLLDTSYDVVYDDDGDKESSVNADRIRFRNEVTAEEGGSGRSSGSGGSGARSSSRDTFCEHQKVEVNYGGKGVFVDAKVTRCRLSGTYDIECEDGQRETEVGSEMINGFMRGGHVDVDKGGKGTWVKAKVARVRHHSVGLGKEIYIDCSEVGIGRAQVTLNDEPLRQSSVGGSCTGTGAGSHHRVGSNLSEVSSANSSPKSTGSSKAGSSAGSDSKADSKAKTHAMGGGNWG